VVVGADPKRTTDESTSDDGPSNGTPQPQKGSEGGEAARSVFTTCVRLHDVRGVWIRGGEVR